MGRPAYSFVRHFEPEPARQLCVDRHYLLCASSGALRLEADGTAWTLPPARAALITAGHAIEVTIPQPVTTSSILVSTDFAPRPLAPLSVFDLTPLARLLIAECGAWDDSPEPLSAYGLAMFNALIATTWALAEHPSAARMPVGRSPETRRALSLTEQHLADNPRFDEIAANVGLTSRTLARRFEEELGMTWRAALRRMRILRAIEMLASGNESVTTIAMHVGYSSLSAFHAAFRDLTDQAPSEYRRGFEP